MLYHLTGLAMPSLKGVLGSEAEELPGDVGTSLKAVSGCSGITFITACLTRVLFHQSNEVVQSRRSTVPEVVDLVAEGVSRALMTPSTTPPMYV